MNIIDALLQTDESKLKKPTKEVEIKRLSEAFGQEFVLVCEALSHEKYEEIQDMTVSLGENGKDVDVKMSDAALMTIVEAVRNKEGELIFKNAELMKHFKGPTPKELVKKLLLSGEVTKLYEIISKLSGYGEGAIEEVKN